MSNTQKIECLMCMQLAGLWAMRPIAIAAAMCMCVSVGYAVDVPTAGEAVTIAERASSLDASGVWALFAGSLFLALMLLGWGVWNIGLKVESRLITMGQDIASLKAHAEHLATRK